MNKNKKGKWLKGLGEQDKYLELAWFDIRTAGEDLPQPGEHVLHLEEAPVVAHSWCLIAGVNEPFCKGPGSK